MVRTALVSGIGGQDGSYLTELLLENGYQVHGFDIDGQSLERLAAVLNTRNDRNDVSLYQADISDAAEMNRIVSAVRPSEVYNLAAEARVDASFVDPLTTMRSIAIGVTTLLEAVRNNQADCRFYQASSSEMFGDAPAPQQENTRFAPVSPYGCAKLLAHHLVATYRMSYGMFVSTGILFNHESERRTDDFVSRKITKGVAEILAGERDKIVLGNLESRRDWGHARDYVRAMWLIMQQAGPRDYVIASGRSHSVADFAELAFSFVGLDWRNHVVSDPEFMRPTDPSNLLGDATRARLELGWRAETSFERLIHGMLAGDLAAHDIDLSLLRSAPV
jgi:GDPmannose 4,6-dehydratase